MNYTQKLQKIQKASGWTQEKLATELRVSFVTLNSWINERSQPRQKALRNIEKLYDIVVGVEEVDQIELVQTILKASKTRLIVKNLIANTQQLETLALHLTYHTNTIEGSTMTLADVEGVLFDHKVLANRTAIEQTEARNHQATLYWLLDQIASKGNDFLINEDLILNIHLRLMNGILSDAGQYRKHRVRISGSQIVLANWVKIPELISDFTILANTFEQNNIELISKTHALFEKIHPFSDGNGRTGRLIMLAQALHLGMMPPIVTKERKYAYYKYLESAQVSEEFDLLKMFVAEAILFADSLLLGDD